MPQSFLAMITPLASGGHPDQGLPGVPPGYWGGIAPPYPDQGLPGAPPGYWGGVAPPLPGHPIAPGGRPPGIWGGAPPYPDQGLPPSGVGVWPGPGRPSNPIYLPPVTPGGPPVQIWPSPGHPAHPIAPTPPDTSPAPPDTAVKPPPDQGGWAFVSSWGWGYFPAPGETGPKTA